MHLALLGVSKSVLSLWLNHVEIQSHIHEIERRIKTIKVPSEIHREPWGLGEVKHWKGKKIIICRVVSYICLYSIWMQSLDIILLLASVARHLGWRVFAAFCSFLRSTVVAATVSYFYTRYSKGWENAAALLLQVYSIIQYLMDLQAIKNNHIVLCRESLLHSECAYSIALGRCCQKFGPFVGPLNVSFWRDEWLPGWIIPWDKRTTETGLHIHIWNYNIHYNSTDY